MSWKEITAGEKTAKPTAARFIKSKNGTMGMEVNFAFNEPSTGTPEHLNWVGWLTADAMENTMKTLVDVLGFNGDDAVDGQGVLLNPQALNYNGEIKLVVELEAYEGKSYPKVKWVNKLGGSAFTSLAPEVIKNDLGALGFKAAFLAAKKGSGPAPSHAAQSASGPMHPSMSESKLPF